MVACFFEMLLLVNITVISVLIISFQMNRSKQVVQNLSDWFVPLAKRVDPDQTAPIFILSI